MIVLLDLSSFPTRIPSIHSFIHSFIQFLIVRPIPLTEGILFLSPNLLIDYSSSPSSPSASQSRYHQVLQWCGERLFDGLIIFDEVGGLHSDASLLDPAVLNRTVQVFCTLQDSLPNARSVYCNAVRGIDGKELEYMTRLGLWGRGTMYSSFKSLSGSLRIGGDSFLEMIYCDLKLNGAFLSRQYAFHDSEVVLEEIQIQKEVASIYEESVQLWRELLTGFSLAYQVGIFIKIATRWK